MKIEGEPISNIDEKEFIPEGQTGKLKQKSAKCKGCGGGGCQSGGPPGGNCQGSCSGCKKIDPIA